MLKKGFSPQFVSHFSTLYVTSWKPFSKKPNLNGRADTRLKYTMVFFFLSTYKNQGDGSVGQMCCSLTMRTWLQFPRTHILKKARCVSTHLQSWFREAEIKEFSSLSYVFQVRRETIPLVTVYWIVPQRLFSMFFYTTYPGVTSPTPPTQGWHHPLWDGSSHIYPQANLVGALSQLRCRPPLWCQPVPS